MDQLIGLNVKPIDLVLLLGKGGLHLEHNLVELKISTVLDELPDAVTIFMVGVLFFVDALFIKFDEEFDLVDGGRVAFARVEFFSEAHED